LILAQNTSAKTKYNGPIPKIHSDGIFEMISSKRKVSFLTMAKHDVSLAKYLDMWETLSLHSITRIIIKLIQALEIIHGCGYVYNNLKFENILLRQKHGKIKIYLVDYVNLSTYLD
jgi:serine/threonine protein kinase